MSGRPRRAYHSPLREEAASRTRAAILAAFAEQLGRPGATDFHVGEAAAAAGVSVRTVQHHFPDRQARIAALAEWAEEVFGALPFEFEHPEELPDFVRAAYARAARNLPLTRAMAVAGVSNDVRLLRLAGRRARIAAVLATLGADPQETRRAAATVALLASSEAGIPLLDLHGLSMDEAGEAAAEATAAIVQRLVSRAKPTRAPGPGAAA